MLFTFFRETPKDIIEASRIDGAGVGQAIVTCFCRWSRPALPRPACSGHPVLERSVLESQSFGAQCRAPDGLHRLVLGAAGIVLGETVRGLGAGDRAHPGFRLDHTAPTGPRPHLRRGEVAEAGRCTCRKYDLTGRTAVVTGGGQGIGFASAAALAEAGARIVIADISAERAAEAATAERGRRHARWSPTARRWMRWPRSLRRGLRRGRCPGQQRRHRGQRHRRRHQRRALADAHGGKSRRAVLVLPRVRRAHAGARQRRDRQYRFDVRFHRQQAAAAILLQCVQGGGASPDALAGRRMGRPWRAGERGRAHLHRHPADAVRQARTSRCTRPGWR